MAAPNPTPVSMIYQTPVVSVINGVTRPTQESIGPSTNWRTVAVLHPDQYQSSPDLGRTATANRPAITAWLPDSLLNNMVFKNPETNNPVSKILAGLDGQYVKKEYAASVSPAAEAPQDQYGSITIPAERKLLSIVQV